MKTFLIISTVAILFTGCASSSYKINFSYQDKNNYIEDRPYPIQDVTVTTGGEINGTIKGRASDISKIIKLLEQLKMTIKVEEIKK